MMWLTTLAVLKDESRSQIWSATMATSLYELAGWLGEGAEERCMISPSPGLLPALLRAKVWKIMEDRRSDRCPCGVRSLVTGSVISS
jgi:hypothetical protein